MNQAVIDQWSAFRSSGGPLVYWITADPGETQASLIEIEAARLKDKIKSIEDLVIWQWDVNRGLTKVSRAGDRAIQAMLPKPVGGASVGSNLKSLTKAAADMLGFVYRLPEELGEEAQRAIVFMNFAHLFFQNESTTTGIWNLRDAFKEIGATLVMFGPPTKLPAHLIQDVTVITEPLPTADDIRRIVLSTWENANEERKRAKQPLIPKLDDETLDRGVGALSGLAAFPAEQTVAMNLNEKGINVNGMWQRKMSYISQMPGVTVWEGNERFEDLPGQDNFQKFARKLLAGRDAPTVICIFDEWDKGGTQGGAGDLSNVTQEIHGYFLSEMHNNDYPGIVLIGPGGSGKTEALKAMANAATGGKTLALMINMAGMKSSLVGSSMANVIQFFMLIKAISGGRALFAFTCNKFNFDAAFQRRCYLGKYFFDLPEQDVVDKKIWPHYLRKYELPKQELPKSIGWTGAEVRACSIMGYRLNEPLLESAKRIIPIAESAADEIDQLRREADGNFVSAYKEGKYQYRAIENISTRRRGRLIDGSQTQN